MVYLRTEEGNEIALTRAMVMIHDLHALRFTINGQCPHGISLFNSCLSCICADNLARFEKRTERKMN
mgnify:CR=1 FL=1